MIFFFSRKWYSIWEILKRIFFWNPKTAKVLAVERDLISRNINFLKLDRWGVINRERAFIQINTVASLLLLISKPIPLYGILYRHMEDP